MVKGSRWFRRREVVSEERGVFSYRGRPLPPTGPTVALASCVPRDVSRETLQVPCLYAGIVLGRARLGLLTTTTYLEHACINRSKQLPRSWHRSCPSSPQPCVDTRLIRGCMHQPFQAAGTELVSGAGTGCAVASGVPMLSGGGVGAKLLSVR